MASGAAAGVCCSYSGSGQLPADIGRGFHPWDPGGGTACPGYPAKNHAGQNAHLGAGPPPCHIRGMSQLVTSEVCHSLSYQRYVITCENLIFAKL